MARDTISFMGIPIDNVTMEDVIDQIFGMVNAFKRDNTPRYVATVNVNFISNTLSWKTGRSRHPELIDILRRSNLVTADGMPIVWISKMMDSPIKERVAGSDMVPRIAEEAAKSGNSIFLFGGEPGLAEKASEILKSTYPGLRIAGTYSPVVSTEGEAMLDSAEEDKEIVDKINKSGADILFIGLGNPKQEIWFERNKSALNVPVSLGIGGSFSFITGDIARAPEWMQKNGLEWLYRIFQDPGRLWKRYFKDFIKLGTCIVFPIVLNKIGNSIIKIRQKKKNLPQIININVRSKEKIVIFNMPGKLTRESIQATKILIPAFKEFSIIVNFKNTVHMDLFGMGFLVSIWYHSIANKRHLFVTGINRFLRVFLKYTRMWDICGKVHHDNLDTLIEGINMHNKDNSFHYTTDSDEDLFKIDLYGRLDAENISKLDIEELLKVIGKKNCIINLKNLEFVDSTGLIFFLKIKKHLSAHNKIPMMCNVNEDIRQIFNITKISDLFKVLPDSDSEKPLFREAI